MVEENQEMRGGDSLRQKNHLQPVIKKQKRVRNWRGRRILMKRRARLEGSRRIERRVRTLKKLIPNGNESMGLDGLFRETAYYILSLQMRVKVMQIMVNTLTGSDEDDQK